MLKITVNFSIISIHTLRMEGDLYAITTRIATVKFQSTPSAWRVTYYYMDGAKSDSISIHTLRMEGDTGCRHQIIPASISIHTLRMEGDAEKFGHGNIPVKDFNPHPPHGG